jgi:hypothetical protein
MNRQDLSSSAVINKYSIYVFAKRERERCVARVNAIKQEFMGGADFDRQQMLLVAEEGTRTTQGNDDDDRR